MSGAIGLLLFHRYSWCRGGQPYFTFFNKYYEHDQSRKCYMNGSEANYAKVAKRNSKINFFTPSTPGLGLPSLCPVGTGGTFSDSTTTGQGVKLIFHLAVVPRLRVHGTVLHSHLPVCLHGCTCHSVSSKYRVREETAFLSTVLAIPMYLRGRE
jgi:hypothetical protein